MKSRTVCFSPGRVTPGMTLAKAICDRDGHILLAAETVLDSEMLDRLVRRGIEAIFVIVLDTRDEETIATEMQAAKSRVEHIFREKGSPAKEALRNAILTFRQESMQ